MATSIPPPPQTAHVTGVTRSSPLIASAVIGALGVMVSLIGSWVPSLWGDEAASVLSARRSLPSLVRMLEHVDAVHGVYYLGLHAWIELAGSSAFAVRLPSAIAVGVCAAAVTWMCRRCGSARFAVVAGVLTAILPRMTYAGEEARSYAFTAALAAILCAILVELMLRKPTRRTRRLWIAYALILGVGTWAFTYFALMIPVAAIAVLATPHLRARWRAWAWSTGLAMAAALPLIVIAVSQRKQVAFLAHRNVVNADAVFVQMWFGSWPVAVAAWALIAFAGSTWVVDCVRSRGIPADRRLDLVATAWLILPMGLLLAATPLVAGFTARYGTMSAPAAAVLMTLGLKRLKTAWLPAAAALAVVALIAPVWMQQRTAYAKNGSDWNDIAATISANAQPGDAVVFDDGVRPSRRPRLAMNTDPVAFAGLSDPTLRTAYADGTSWHDTAYTVSEAVTLRRFEGVDRVWVIEYARPTADVWGIADLQAAGYREVQRIDGRHHVISLFVRGT